MFHEFDPEKHIKITKRYGFNGKIIPTLDINDIDPIMANGTIFDESLTTKFGFVPLPKNIPNRFYANSIGLELPEDRRLALEYIKTEFENNQTMIDILLSNGKSGIILPMGINLITNCINGISFMNQLQRAAYRLVAQIVSFSGAFQYASNNKNKLMKELQAVDQATELYFKEIASGISEKQGKLRKVIHPRQKCGAFGVLVNRNDLNLDEVLVPRRAIKNWLLNDEYLAKTGLPKDYAKFGNEEFDALFKNQRVLVIAMPDHDENCALFCKVRLWSGNGIGIHPALAMVMYRDFDGDLIFIKGFCTKEADKELMCLSPDNHLEAIKLNLSKCYKDVGKDAKSLYELQKAIKQKSESVAFMSTDLKSAAEIENVKPDQEKRFIKLIEGISIEDIPMLQANAAKDFNILKKETANAGDMGNQMRIICSTISRDAVKHANNFYHIVAQSALNSKHGSINIVEKIGRILRNTEMMPDSSDKLYITLQNIMGKTVNSDLIKTISQVFYNKDGILIGDISSVNESVSTINAIIRGNYYKLLHNSVQNDFCVQMLKYTLTK